MKSSRWIIFFVVFVLVVAGVWFASKQVAPLGPPASQIIKAQSSLPTIPDPCIADGKIKTVVGPRSSTLYFMCFQLNSSTVRLDDPGAISAFQGDDGQFEGGEFEVIVQPTAFPVPAPKSCKGIIVRMPWSLYTQSPDAKANIAAKKTLYGEISALKSSPGKQVNVVLNLNRYVSVVQANPLKLQLRECNVFFRDVAGKYTPNLN